MTNLHIDIEWTPARVAAFNEIRDSLLDTLTRIGRRAEHGKRYGADMHTSAQLVLADIESVVCQVREQIISA